MTPAERIANKKVRRTPKSESRRPTVWRCTVREYRERLGLTYREIGEALHLSAGFLVDVERGADVRLTNAIGLAKFFGVTIQDLWPERIET